MCKVSVTEFRKHLFHYIERCSVENVLITRRGKVIAVLSNPDKQYYQTLGDLCGCLKADLGDKSYDDLIGEAILEKQKQMSLLKLKERLLDIELEQSRSAKTYSVDELDAALKEIV